MTLDAGCCGLFVLPSRICGMSQCCDDLDARCIGLFESPSARLHVWIVRQSARVHVWIVRQQKRSLGEKGGIVGRVCQPAPGWSKVLKWWGLEATSIGLYALCFSCHTCAPSGIRVAHAECRLGVQKFIIYNKKYKSIIRWHRLQVCALSIEPGSFCLEPLAQLPDLGSRKVHSTYVCWR